MANAELMAEIIRGDMVESQHTGHAVVVDAKGQITEAWGNPDEIIFPRSSAKILQALPLLESGAGAGLSGERLALACASHNGERQHVDRVARWLAELGLTEEALCCGPQASRDRTLRHDMIRAGQTPGRMFNNCSGKHTGFLTLTQHLKAGADYVDPEHPVQKMVLAAFEEMTGENSPGVGIDGCSAPNFATSLSGLARAMSRFATAGQASGARDQAASGLRDAMIAHPELVAGTGGACTELMLAAEGRAAAKTGAEGVYVAILPDRGLGVALKITDGATRAAEIAIAALLVRLGAIERGHPVAQRYLERPIRNWDGLVTGAERAAPGLAG